MNGSSFIDGLFTKGLGWRRGYSRSVPSVIPLTCDWLYLFFSFYLFALVCPFDSSFVSFPSLFPLSSCSPSAVHNCMRCSVEYYDSFPENSGAEWRTRDLIITRKVFRRGPHIYWSFIDFFSSFLFHIMTRSLLDRFFLVPLPFICDVVMSVIIPRLLWFLSFLCLLFLLLRHRFLSFCIFFLSHFGLIGVGRRYAKEWSMDWI